MPNLINAYRFKNIGKSTYRIVKENGRFHIMETYLTKTARSSVSYRTMDEALQTLATFDRERIVIGG